MSHLRLNVEIAVKAMRLVKADGNWTLAVAAETFLWTEA